MDNRPTYPSPVFQSAPAVAPTRSALHPLFPSLATKGSYRIREIARATGFSRQSLHRAIERGQLQALKQGPRTYRIPAKSLLDYINSIYHDPFQ